MRKNVMKAIDAMLAGKKWRDPRGSVWTDGVHVYSYNTCLIARYHSNGERFALNATKYSQTTGRQQSTARHYLGYYKGLSYTETRHALPFGARPVDVTGSAVGAMPEHTP